MIIFYLLPLILFFVFFFLDKNNKKTVTNASLNKNEIDFKPLEENKVKKKTSGINVTLNIGVIFIILSSIIFST